ncbi:hypothetical protein ACFCXH_00400 [Streptomyces nojiriensis]|uniref:hypothetical protein n=1 Tax=Streptomyces nojiriensis TaxID=66374 RepID=UPI0035D57241
MAKPPTVTGVLTGRPDLVEDQPHTAFGVGGRLIGYLVGTHLHDAPQQPAPATPAPVTTGARYTPTAHSLAA